jgi:hypothetical protein
VTPDQLFEEVARANGGSSIVGLSGASAIAAGQLHSMAAGTASPTTGTQSGSATIAAGGTVSTDVDGDGATLEDPVEVSLMSPVGGEVSITKRNGHSYSTGATVAA